MRTRSQKASPSGFVALADRVRRRRKITTAPAATPSEVPSTRVDPPSSESKSPQCDHKTAGTEDGQPCDDISRAENNESQVQDETLPTVTSQEDEDFTSENHSSPRTDTQDYAETPQEPYLSIPEKRIESVMTPPSVNIDSVNLYAAAAAAMLSSPDSTIQAAEDQAAEEELEKTCSLAVQEMTECHHPASPCQETETSTNCSLKCPTCMEEYRCPNGHHFSSFMTLAQATVMNAILTKLVAEQNKENATLRKENEHIREQARNQKVVGKQKQKMTQEKKRPSDKDEEHYAVTPKRRMTTGPAGSTPFARPLAPRTSPYKSPGRPYSERRRRRELERDGRIHYTLFHIPEMIEQRRAEAMAAEVAAESGYDLALPRPYDSIAEPTEEDFFEVPVFRKRGLEPKSTEQNQEFNDVSQPPQTPQTPQTPRSNWGIRGLLGSASRSLGRFLPNLSFPADLENPFVTRAHSPSTPTEPTLPELPTPSKEPVTRDLSYDLFPRGLDRSLYLPAPSAAPSKDSEKANEEDTKEEITVTPMPDAINTKAIDKNAGKKRKRAVPSPDIIPNPVGSSYGMDLDFFTYSSDSDTSPPAPTPAPRKQSASVRPTKPRPTNPRPKKRVRFDASPEDTPSKVRARAATAAYTGQAFVGIRDPFTPTAIEPRTNDTAPNTSLPSVFRPQSELMTSTTTTTVAQAADMSQSVSMDARADQGSRRIPSNEVQPEAAQAATPASTVEAAQQPATPLLSAPTVETEAIAKARSQAEKYKPKTPSGLRASSRYSSPFMRLSPLANTTSNPSPLAVSAVPNPTLEEEKTRQITEMFGTDDEFARDAYELYQNCPNGDLTQLTWPDTLPRAHDIALNSEALHSVDRMMTQAEFDVGFDAFSDTFKHFQNAFEEGHVEV